MKPASRAAYPSVPILARRARLPSFDLTEIALLHICTFFRQFAFKPLGQGLRRCPGMDHRPSSDRPCRGDRLHGLGRKTSDNSLNKSERAPTSDTIPWLDSSTLRARSTEGQGQGPATQSACQPPCGLINPSHIAFSARSSETQAALRGVSMRHLRTPPNSLEADPNQFPAPGRHSRLLRGNPSLRNNCSDNLDNGFCEADVEAVDPRLDGT
jgi:hypothetical protein